jgi:short subunit dehydrogenase-like uncharacterized protein
VSADREFDIVLFGASGFVGRLCAEYLATAATPEARIALAGRSSSRLAAVKDALGPAAAAWPVLVADTGDADAMSDLAKRTRVVATTVGPYRLYGRSLAQACATEGTHYADLSGEVLFMRESIDSFDEAAQASGARIVHSCGFDSIPSDLGVLLLHEAVAADGEGTLGETTFVVRALRGGVSGGTIASLKSTLDAARSDGRLAQLLLDPYALSPDRDQEPRLASEQDMSRPERNDELDMWLAPFVMGRINTRVVRRSNALADWAYGREFRYREVMGFSSGPLGAVQAGGLAAGIGALELGLSTGPVRSVLDKVLPSPGQGPGKRMRERGFFRIDIHTRTSTGARYVCQVAAKGDPGYKATAVMFGQAGLCLAFDSDALPKRAGVLTPATAMGDVLVARLRAAGQTFDVQRIS